MPLNTIKETRRVIKSTYKDSALPNTRLLLKAAALCLRCLIKETEAGSERCLLIDHNDVWDDVHDDVRHAQLIKARKYDVRR